MKKIPNGQADLAITYVNLAHLYEEIGQKKKDVGKIVARTYGTLTKKKRFLLANVPIFLFGLKMVELFPKCDIIIT
jgi:hypothetical protein